MPPWDLIAEQIPQVVGVTDSAGSLVYFNRRGLDVVGLAPEEMSGWQWLGVVHPDDASHTRESWEGAVRNGAPFHLEFRVRTAGGDYRWVAARAVPLRGSDGQASGWAGTWTDVDDLKRLQDQLGGAQTRPAASLAVLEALQATTPVGIGFVDRDLRVIHMNEFLAEVNGSSSQEIKGRMLAEVSTVWPQVEPAYRQVLEAGEGIANVRVERTVNGRRRHWLNSYFPVRIATEIIGVVVVGLDVTERQRDEDFRSVVLENVIEGLNIAQLIGDLAHDLDERFDAILDNLDSEVVAAALGDRSSADHLQAQDVASVQPQLGRGSGQPGSDLTAREQEVLRLMASGLANRDIAAHLNLSVNTIRGHVQHVLDKLGAHSKLEAVAMATRQGLAERQP
jgi:PAS domain S-box-containing protein